MSSRLFREELERVVTDSLRDSGADGILVPTVETVDQVTKLIEWIKYPPIGRRGFGVARAQGYGHNLEEYIESWNETSILLIQIESIAAVENIDRLLHLHIEH